MSRDYQTEADRCRAALKAAGYGAKQVTVRDDGSNTHTSLRLTIRDAAVSISHVEAIAGAFERIHRCHATGEILSGGNTFVDVNYTDVIVKAVAAPVEARIRGEQPNRTVYAAPFARVYVEPKSISHEEVHRLDSHARTCWDIASAALQIAREMLDRGYGRPVAADWLERMDLDDAPAPTCAHGAALSVSCLACHAAAN